MPPLAPKEGVLWNEKEKDMEMVVSPVGMAELSALVVRLGREVMVMGDTEPVKEEEREGGGE